MNALINSLINATWGRLTGLWRTIVVVGAVLVLALALWHWGAKVTHGLSSWWYRRSVAAAQQEIDAYHQQADAAKAVAQQALAELAAQKLVTEQERAKREAAEKVLNDATIKANDKLKAYEQAISKLPDVSPVGDTDALCKRAAALGISCGPAN